MTYLVPADFRAQTLLDPTIGLALSASEAPDPALTAAIDRCSARLDELCDDHFEPQAAVTILVAGLGSERLVLPRRVRAVTSVALRQQDGSFLVQSASAYQVVSSVHGPLYTDVNVTGEIDYLLIPKGSNLSGSSDGARVWPTQDASVRVIGDFGWPAVHPDAQRAVALMVWTHFRPLADVLRQASRVVTVDAQVDLDTAGPTEIPEVNRIVRRLARRVRVGVI